MWNANVALDNRIWKLQQRTDLTIGQNDLLHTADVAFLQDRDAEAEVIITAIEKELGV
jgi:hypothetical protein